MESMESGKWTRLALYQEKLQDGMVRCHLCPHNCVIREGGQGICQSRVNVGGKLYTLTYGNPCSLSMDPIEKKPLFHFFPGTRILSVATAGCNMRCLNCQNWQISQTSPRLTDHYELYPEEVVSQTRHHDSHSIAFTYTEPTVFYEYMMETAKIAHENKVKTVIVSNGYINAQPLLDLCPYLDAANIDLKCFDDATYHKLTGGHLQPVLDTLITLRERGVWLEITNLLVPGWSDKQSMVRAMCRWLVGNGFAETPLHFSRFFPNHKLLHLPPTDPKLLMRAEEIAENEGMKYVYIGNIPGLLGENTYCPSCQNLLVERSGFTVLRNEIRKGCCRFCGEAIPGVWG